MPDTKTAPGTPRESLSTVRWQPDRRVRAGAVGQPLPPMPTALLRGLRGYCPACGQGRIFSGYLRVVDACSVCAAPLGSVRADDAPPYFTIFIVGHIVVLGMVMLENADQPPLWVHAAIWLPLTLVLSLLLLRPIKGATVGLMMKFGLMKSEGDTAGDA